MDYIPIDCNFYDYIEHFAVQKKAIKIVFFSIEGQESEITDTIINTKIQDKAEYILLDNHAAIRCDRIISLNGMVNPQRAK